MIDVERNKLTGSIDASNIPLQVGMFMASRIGDLKLPVPVLKGKSLAKI